MVCPLLRESFDCVLAKLVRPERFELPTYSSGGCRSIQLSYGRAAVMQVYIVRPEWLNRREEAKLRSSWTGEAPPHEHFLQSAFDRRHRTPLPLVRLQDLLAQAKRLRRNLDKLIVGNEFDRLFEIKITIRNQPDRFVRS